MNEQQAQEYRAALEAGEKPPVFDEETTTVEQKKPEQETAVPAEKKTDGAGEDHAKPKEQETAPKVEGKPEEKQDTEPPSLEERVDQMQGIVDKLQGRLRKAEGHVGSLKDQLKRANQQSRQQAKEEKVQGVRQQREALFDSLIEEYPELSDDLGELRKKVDSLTEAEIKELTTSLEPEEPEFEESNISQIYANIDKDKRLNDYEKSQLKTMFAYDPEWTKTQASEDFKTWFASQSQTVQDLENSEQAKDWIRLHTLYLNRDTGSGKPTAKEINEQRRKEVSRSAHVHQSGTDTMNKPVELMTEQEYRLYKESQREKT